MKNVLLALKRFATYLITSFTPSNDAWRTAFYGVSAVWVLILAITSWTLVLSDFTIYRLLAYFVLIGALLLAGFATYLLIRLLAKLPNRFALALIMPLPISLLMLPGLGPKTSGVLIGGSILSIAMMSGALGAISSGGFQPRGQKVSTVMLLLATSGLVFILYISFFKHQDQNPALASYSLDDQTLDFPDPSAKGSYAVGYTTYGSGKDLHRAEYGEAVGFMSQPVDGSRLIDQWEGALGWARSSYWGFGPEALPVQGRVWYPQGEGPFPLVLIVHGNHSMEDYSDAGYGYLGELLASRGYIFVSVDQNFLNLSVSDFLSITKRSLKEENDARGWLLLEHLVQWREWNTEPEHPFNGKVDIDKISLIGHSRGGEAVAIASYFNQIGFYPDDAHLAFDYHFNITGIIAIAPVDGQYKPREKGTPVSGTNYFSVHGSMDGDVRSFMGLSQYNRVALTEPGQFAATLYISGANHGQFNTDWGDQDTWYGWSLNKNAIMDETAQRQIASVYFSAFLDICNKDRTEYMPIFADATKAASWLPDTFYINNLREAATVWVMNFEEDGDLASATFPGARVVAVNLSRWSEAWVSLKWNPLETHAVLLAWDDDYKGDAAFGVVFDGMQAADFDALVFSLSRNNGATMPVGHKRGEMTDNKIEEMADEQPLDWSIVIVDKNGMEYRQLLSNFGSLYPQVKEDTRKAQFGYTDAQSEAVFKYYEIQLEQFASSDGTQPSEIKQIRFEFDQSPKGTIILDDVGLKRIN